MQKQEKLTAVTGENKDPPYIEKLSEEQLKTLDLVAERHFQKFYAQVENVDLKKIAESVQELCMFDDVKALYGKKPPQIIQAKGPNDMRRIIKELGHKDNISLTNSVSLVSALPIVSWARGYEALGFPGFGFIDVVDRFISQGVFLSVFLPEAVVFTLPPDEIHFNERRQFHSTTRPCIAFREDGFEVYCFNNITVPKSWVTDKENVDVMEILKTPNLERRNAGCNLVGWARILAKLNAILIDEDDPEVGSLYEASLPGSTRKERFLKVRCGTGRDFVVCVPSSTETAIDAQKLLHSQDLEDIFIVPVRT